MGRISYILDKKIAQGGMAEIFLGKAVGEDTFQRIVAIKRILPHYSEDKEFVKMFRNEAHICKRLQHTNIAQVYDFREVENSYAIIMEYVDGVDFRTLLAACEKQKNSLPVPMAIYIAVQTARGLHYAHTKVDEVTNQQLEIIHRDVSPQNILISFLGDVKVTDFGIATTEDKLSETRPGVVKGKYSYMSPEQASAKRLDCRSDVFSLAIVLWESLAMRRLFSGKSEVETIRKVHDCKIPYQLTRLNPNVSPQLEEIVLKALQKDPKSRYQTAAEFEKVLFRYLNSSYPDFNPAELGRYLKTIHSEKFAESKVDKKRILTKQDKPKDPEDDWDLEDDLAISQNWKEKQERIYSHTKSSKELGEKDRNKPRTSSLSIDKKSYRPARTQSYYSTSSTQAITRPTGLATKMVRKTSRKKYFLWMPVIAIAVYFGMQTNLEKTLSFFSFTSKHFTVHLETEPSNVLVHYDSVNIATTKKDKLSKYRYTQTPLKLIKTADRKTHTLTIKRPGYFKKTIRLPRANPGEVYRSKFIELRKKGALATATIQNDRKFSHKIAIDFEYGLQKGDLPIRVKNLARGHRYRIYFKSKLRSGSCVVKLSRRQRRPAHIKINPIGILPCRVTTRP